MKPEDLERIAELVAAKLGGKKAPAEREKAEVMVTLTARVPQEYLEVLDRIGPTRSEALRDILRAAAANTRKKA